MYVKVVWCIYIYIKYTPIAYVDFMWIQDYIVLDLRSIESVNVKGKVFVKILSETQNRENCWKLWKQPCENRENRENDNLAVKIRYGRGN